jgi:integrase
MERKHKTKPRKPYKAFPLFAHANGQWAKKIRGKLHYFGPWAKHVAAMDLYVARREYLHAGLAPKDDTRQVSVRSLVNQFLTSQNRKLELGEIGKQHFADYYRSCEFVIETFGKNRPAESLGPDDFGRLRAQISNNRSPVTVTNHITRIRSMFKWAARAEITKQPAKYGDEFSKPRPKLLRQARQKRENFFFSAVEIRDLVDLASRRDPQVAAMILLGINAGLGCTDCAKITADNIDLESDVLDYPRPKTGIQRRAILWPETIEAITKSQRFKKPPFDKAFADRLFLTRIRTPWVQVSDSGLVANPLSLSFRKCRDILGISRRGVAFNALRHTFRTVADETRDFPAIDLIMGHNSGSGGGVFAGEMADRYREKISDDRLRAISDFVRDWLFS